MEKEKKSIINCHIKHIIIKIESEKKRTQLHINASEEHVASSVQKRNSVKRGGKK